MPRTRHARVRIVKIVSRRNPRRRRNPLKAGWHRPRVRLVKGRFSRSKFSRFWGKSKGSIMLNPRRRRRGLRHNPRFMRRHRRHLRRNPNIKAILNQLKSKSWIMQTATIGGGIAAGFAMKSVVSMLITKANQPNLAKYGGALQIVIGAVLYATMRKPALRTIGGIVAGIGLYDLIQQVALPTQLPAIPSMNLPALPGMKSAAASYGYSYGPKALEMPRMAPAHRPIAASYGASYSPAQGFSGMDNPYGDIEW